MLTPPPLAPKALAESAHLDHKKHSDHAKWPMAYVCLADEPLRSRVSRLLQEAGYAVVAFTDGVAFLTEAADAPSSTRTSWEPDLIVSEVDDPRHTPLELLEGTEELGYRAPILMFAARDHEIRQRPLHHYASSVVFVVPGDMDELVAFASLIRFQRSKAL